VKNQMFKIINKSFYNIGLGLVSRLLFLLAITNIAIAQKKEFSFLDLPQNATINAMGGRCISYSNGGSTSYIANPSLMDSIPMANADLEFSFLAGVAGISNLAYSTEISNTGYWNFGAQYFNFGTFDGYDEIGNKTGTFNSYDFAVVVGKSHQVGPFSMGGNLKFVQSSISQYSSNAILFDLGSTFSHPHKDLQLSLLVRNVGFYTSQFSGTNNGSLPLNVLAGATFKPEHMPFRFTLTLHHLNNWGNAYFDPDSNLEENEKPGTVDKVFRHMSFGLELLLGKHVSVYGGYDYLKRKELSISQKKGLSGYSFGTTIRVKRFQLSYGNGIYHIAGSNHQIGLNFNLNLKRKKTV